MKSWIKKIYGSIQEGFLIEDNPVKNFLTLMKIMAIFEERVGKKEDLW